ncbi:MAG: hypothetical protein NXI04_01410 [Planctomycetaceae bacterium]|nr:hypothetical protein [Planctomycetaceae bacterium]
MIVLQRFLQQFHDSPTHERDRANLMSAFTVGATALILNFVILMMVAPLILAPDDRDFRDLTENIEFGQLLALILLGGATAFATLLIPFRLASVFLGPRIGRYFDQILLSGITPFRFVIGKATSQNLYLGLIFLLLLPYLVLSITLGGMDITTFVAGVLLVWLYCMMLAAVTLWVSLYVNELLSAVFVVGVFAILSGIGCAPIPVQVFTITPFPVLLQPVYASLPDMAPEMYNNYWVLYGSSVIVMTSIGCLALFSIHIGPLFGIIVDNSTFGEVVRKGDSKRKRWFRLRHHIQRPSEIAFFYENRGTSLRAHEGLLRWGLGAALIFGVSTIGFLGFVALMGFLIKQWGPPGRNWAPGFRGMILAVHGIGVLLAALLFSHGRNTTFLRLPVWRRWRPEVARLDTICFLAFLTFSTGLAIATPHIFEHFVASSQDTSIFYIEPDSAARWAPFGLQQMSVEGALILSISGLTVYCLLRFLALTTWLKSLAFGLTAVLYLGFVILLPFLPAVLTQEIIELRRIEFLKEFTPQLALTSPAAAIVRLFSQLGPAFPVQATSIPFYVAHALLIGVLLLAIRRSSRTLRQSYLKTDDGGTSA